MIGNVDRKPHADINMPLRALKARKIEVLLGRLRATEGGRLLEVGTGSGAIAHYFAHESGLRWSVSAVDVVDNRQRKDGYGFELIEGCELPFADRSFDVAISNHVIEHVGDAQAQLRHLQELRRTLKTDGTIYLAAPNKWMLVEPHYRMPLLSWLPASMADMLVRWSGRGRHYDCRPLAAAQLEQMLREAGFVFEQKLGEALRLTYELERPNALAYRWFFRRIPDGLYKAFRRLFPTLIYVLRPGPIERAAHEAQAAQSLHK